MLNSVFRAPPTGLTDEHKTGGGTVKGKGVFQTLCIKT